MTSSAKVFAKFFKEKPRAHWMEQLEANDVPHTPVYNMQEVFQDPQIKHMGLEIKIERKDKPTIRTVAFPNAYSDSKNPHPLPPPSRRAQRGISQTTRLQRRTNRGVQGKGDHLTNCFQQQPLAVTRAYPAFF